MHDVVLAEWTHVATQAGEVAVFPDGCRDLIVRDVTGCSPEIIVTPLDDRARRVALRKGERLQGLRFRPGVQIDERALLNSPLHTLQDLEAGRLDGIAPPSRQLQEAMQALEMSEMSVDAVASGLGISARTLQRVVASGTNRTPNYWRRLARVRKAARAIMAREELSDLAARLGFSDQPHLTRECRHWFGVTPGRLAREASIASLLDESGYG